MIRSGSELGEQVKDLMDQGKFVPDEIVTEIIRDRVSSPDCANGFILDGFPRNLAQAEALVDMGIKVNKALLIDVPDEVLVDRVQGRVMCDKCGASYHLKNNPPPWRVCATSAAATWRHAVTTGPRPFGPA